MPNPTVASSGEGDLEYIQMLRDFVEDTPVFSPQQISGNGTSSEYRLGQFPVWDGDLNFVVSVGGAPQTVVTSRTGLGAGQVYIDYETGWMFFGSAPGAGSNNIQIRCSKVRWRDIKLKQALYAGMAAMFPRLWQKKVDQSSITLQVNQWDYPLPGSDWADPRTRLYSVEVQLVPNSYERFQPMQIWRRAGFNILHIPYSQQYPPGGILRLEWAGPYSALSDLEPQVRQLPLWYAKGYLLSNRETVRTRFDQANVTQGEQANPPGSSQNAGAFFMRQFEQELVRMTKPMPMAPIQYSYTR